MLLNPNRFYQQQLETTQSRSPIQMYQYVHPYTGVGGTWYIHLHAYVLLKEIPPNDGTISLYDEEYIQSGR